MHLDAQGRGRALRAGGRERRRRRRLHGRRPVDRSGALPATGRAARSRGTATWPSGPGCRASVARGARAEARAHLARLQPAAPHGLRTRSSDAQCGFKAVRPDVARALLPLVGTPGGSSTPSCSCSPNAPGCASTRCPSIGSTTRTHASTSWRTALMTCRGVWRVLRHRRRPAGDGDRRPDLPDRHGRPNCCRSPPSASSARCSTLVLASAAARYAARRRRPNALARCHRGRQHRREPSPPPSACRGPRNRTRHYAGSAPSTWSGSAVSVRRPRPAPTVGDPPSAPLESRRCSSPVPSPPSCASWSCARGCSIRPGTPMSTTRP